MKTYASKKNFIAAIRKLETSSPALPMKGRGNARVPTNYGEMLAAVIGRDITNCNHVCRVFARRSTRAKYNRMQWGGDADYVSPELAAILESNQDHVLNLMLDFAGHVEWIKVAA